MLWPSPPLSMRRRLSRCAAASIAMPPRRRHHYRHAKACLIAPLSRQRLVVASSPLSTCQCLSCRADASLVALPPLSLRRRLSCGASIAPASCHFANYLDVPPSLLSSRLIVVLLPLSLRRSLSLCHLSHCAAVSLGHIPSQQEKAYQFARGV
jgi:hypothetical protein